MFMEYLLYARHISKYLMNVVQLILIAAVGDGHFYNPHITVEETEAQSN